MLSIQPFLYRDAKPIETIRRIKDILSKLNIFVTEDIWFKNGNYLHSVRISFDKSFIAQNGKGLSKEAALASAYAELMERMQNQLLYLEHRHMIINYNLSLNASDFMYAHDEVFLTPSKLIDIFGKPLLSIFSPCRGFECDPEIWLELFTQDGRLLCIPYVDILSGKILPLPLELVRFHYGTTGMCAGNTMHEALVHGMCEVAERHVLDIIHHQEITPPEMNTDILSKSPVLRSTIDEIEETGPFRISLKDCSLNLNLPVVAGVICDRSQGTYHVSLGVHPNIDEAIARTLTENFQGRFISNYKGSTKINLNESDFDNTPGSNNFNSVWRTGDGAYPNSFFFGKSSYSNQLFISNRKLNTKQAYQFMHRVLRNVTNGPIFVRDVSFLGFPSYQIIAPGMASRRYTFDQLRLYSERTELAELLMDLDRRKRSELIRIRDLIERVVEKGITLHNNIADFTWAPLRHNCQWAIVDPMFILFLLNTAVGAFEKAISNLEEFIDKIPSEKKQRNLEAFTYFSALRDFLILKERRKYSNNSARDIVEKFYSRKIVEDVIRTFENGKRRFVDLKIPRCFNCNECDLQKECDFPMWKKVYSILKEEMVKSRIAQDNLFRRLREV